MANEKEISGKMEETLEGTIVFNVPFPSHWMKRD